MSVNKIDNAPAGAGEVISAFLQENHRPTTAAWKLLMAEYPHFAGEIADAAILQKGVQHLEERDVEGHLNQEAYRIGVSKAINLVHSTPSAQLGLLEEKVSAVRGARVRKLAVEIGLGNRFELVSSILAGTVVAPKKVLLRLCAAFDTSVMALHEFFRRSFDASELPAYKAENGKPLVTIEPTPWEDAVRALKPSPKEMQELLSLDE